MMFGQRIFWTFSEWHNFVSELEYWWEVLCLALGF